jgi:hypothetical protein
MSGEGLARRLAWLRAAGSRLGPYTLEWVVAAVGDEPQALGFLLGEPHKGEERKSYARCQACMKGARASKSHRK